MNADTWRGCPVISIDPEVVHGEAVFCGSRLPVENVISSVYAFEELRGMTEEQAIAATLKSFPSTPGGAETIRQVLAYYEAHEYQLTP